MPRIEFPNFVSPEYDYSIAPYNAAQLDGSRCNNLYPETAKDFSRQRRFLIARPGMAAFTTLANSPIRAFGPYNGVLYSVAGTHFMSTVLGPSNTDFGAMGGSSGGGPAQIVVQGAATAVTTQQQFIMDSSSFQIYHWNGAAMISVFNARALEYLDGFLVAIANGASLQNANQPNQVNVCAFGDGTNWLPGPGATQAFAIRVGAPDFINGLAVLNGFLWVFGQKATEIWYNAGTSPFPFARYQGATLNIGCMAQFSIVKFQNTIVWMGQDHTGYPQVYMTKGMAPVKISDPYIESYISNVGVANGISYVVNSWAYGYQEGGHTFYVLMFWNGTTMLSTGLVYDLTEGLWHSRTYGGVIPNQAAGLPNLQTSGGIYIGSVTTGQILSQSLANTADQTTGGAAQSITYTRIAPYVQDLTKVMRHRRFEVVGNFGTAQPVLSYSDNLGASYKPVTYTLGALGTDQGLDPSTAFQRYYAHQLGRSRGRLYKLSFSDSTNNIRIAGAYLDLDEGNGV